MKLKRSSIALAILLLTLPCFIQSTFSQSASDFAASSDAFAELDKEYLSLRFFNAITGSQLPGGSVTIKDIGTFTTDSDGKVRFKIPEDENYEVRFEKKGFITSDFNIEVAAGTLFYGRFSVSPDMDKKFIRIVLDWDNKPKDLDAHLEKEGEYHISYRHTKNYSDGIAMLDRDDRDGYGPETITIKELDAKANYEFYVHDYTNKRKPKNKLSKSKACVKVYGEGVLLNVFNVPRNVKGNKWVVFRWQGGNLATVDEVR